MITATLTRHIPLKLNDKKLRDTVVKGFLDEYSSYNSEVDGAATLKDVRRRVALIAEFISDSQRK